jgi:hypothetical protein
LSDESGTFFDHPVVELAHIVVGTVVRCDQVSPKCCG